jgi:hypothetical protein
MKTFKLNLSERDIIIQVPDELETNRDEIFALASMELAEQIADGNVRIIERTWPCIYCSKRCKNQIKLQTHLHTHDALKTKLKGKLKHLYEKPSVEDKDEDDSAEVQATSEANEE